MSATAYLFLTRWRVLAERVRIPAPPPPSSISPAPLIAVGVFVAAAGSAFPWRAWRPPRTP